MKFDLRRDLVYTIIAIISTALAIAIPVLQLILAWRRRGSLAKIMRCHGRQAKRKDFK